MRLVLVICILVCLAIASLGVHLARKEQERIVSLSATAPAVILEKRLERHERQRHIHGPRETRGDRFIYEPIVRFRFQVQGRDVTSDNIVPDDFRIGGNIGRRVAQAMLDAFEVGQQATAHFNPQNPSDACLIRRPALFPYLAMLFPVIVASGLIAGLWPSRVPQQPETRRQRWHWIAACWHTVGVMAAGHYFWLAVDDYSGAALAVFALYTQVGLVPVAFALPPSRPSQPLRHIKGAIFGSLVGTFVGLWLGLFAGWLATSFFSASAGASLKYWGYTIAITASLFALFGAMPGWKVGEEVEAAEEDGKASA